MIHYKGIVVGCAKTEQRNQVEDVESFNVTIEVTEFLGRPIIGKPLFVNLLGEPYAEGTEIEFSYRSTGT